MEYKISIILPVYNGENDLNKSINSLIKQTIGFENIELIIVDDNSSDNSKKLIDKYSEKYQNIKTIFLDNNSGTAGKPRNIGVAHSSSNFIMFIDQDDEYLEDACNLFYEKIKNNDVDLVIANTIEIRPKCEIKSKFKYNNSIIKVNINENPEFIYFAYSGAMWNKIFKKDIINTNDIKCLENGLSEDTFFVYEYYLNTKQILYLPKYYGYKHYLFRDNGKSLTENSSTSFISIKFKSMDENIQMINCYENSKKFCQNVLNHFADAILALISLSNNPKNDKITLFKDYYDLNKKYGFYIKNNNYALKILNYLILNKKFNLSYILSIFLKYLSFVRDMAYNIINE
ncbi:MAG: glycosyltransferase [Methanobacteriaceae archaeon]|jgi:glycosyltransferase involved in cell wall biosynthesis|nr:glycosyltransferase [Methanobacteriaceae archaeon]